MQTIVDSVHNNAITRTKDGRYTTYVADSSKPGGRRQIRKKSKAELYRYLLEYYGLKDIDKGDMLFSELYREWVEYKQQFVKATNKKRSISPSTIRRYERDFENYIQGFPIENKKIMQITGPQLEVMVKDIIEKKDLSEKCAGNLIGYIRQAFAYARRSGYIKEDPAEMLDRALLLSMCRFTPPKSDEDKVLTLKELVNLRESVLFHEARHPSYMPDYAIELAMLTGMRVGELAALHWGDVDDEYIHIDYSEHRLDYTDRHSELVIDEPKSGKHRKLQMTDEIKKIFSKVRNIGYHSDDDFVFCHKSGERYTGHDISCAVDRRAEEAGVRKTSIHGIRRTVSSLLNTILPQKAVADMLGHTERVNEQHYNYSMAENTEKMRALEEVSSKVINFKAVSQDKKTAINA